MKRFAVLFIDGFSGGRLPPGNTIREIRINQKPFLSEYDRLGLGRIEILTKSGADNFCRIRLWLREKRFCPAAEIERWQRSEGQSSCRV
jgi:hypothetical protein